MSLDLPLLDQIAAACKKSYQALIGTKGKEVRDIESELKITKEREGFRVISGREHYEYFVDINKLESLFDDTVLPLVEKNPNIQLHDLLQEVEVSKDRVSGPVPWAGLYLLAKWRIIAQADVKLPKSRTLALRNAEGLLSRWYERYEPPVTGRQAVKKTQ